MKRKKRSKSTVATDSEPIDRHVAKVIGDNIVNDFSAVNFGVSARGTVKLEGVAISDILGSPNLCPILQSNVSGIPNPFPTKGKR
jgi:hypothetical protein